MIFLIFIATFVAVACLGLPLAILAAFAVMRSGSGDKTGERNGPTEETVALRPPPVDGTSGRPDRIEAWRV